MIKNKIYKYQLHLFTIIYSFLFLIQLISRLTETVARREVFGLGDTGKKWHKYA